MSDYPANSQEYENPKKKFKARDNGENSLSDKACQTEGPWDTIIVNKVPLTVDYDKLISVFSQYGDIENTYLCKKPKWGGMKHERLARITFRNEVDALKVWKASQEKLIKYDNHVLMVTLASTDFSPIQNLPDTCLREILKRVNSLEDKLSVEMVCRRWRDHGRCCWSDIREINVDDGRINVWRTIFSRVANSLEYLDFRHCDDDTEEILGVAAEHCVRLKRLECIIFELDYDLFSLPIHIILQKNKDLARFQLQMYATENLNMNFMEALPARLYEIDIRAKRTTAILSSVVPARLENLRVLILHNVTITRNQAFDNLMNLEHLALVNSDVPEVAVSTVLRNNKDLKYLDIATDDLTDTSLMYLQKLPNLQVLVIESARFTDEHLQKMRSLKALSCSACPRISDVGMKRYLNSASNITHLSLFDCSTSSRSVRYAKEWTERTGKSLKVFVGDSVFRDSVRRRYGTEYLQIHRIDNGGVHDATGRDWFRDLVE